MKASTCWRTACCASASQSVWSGSSTSTSMSDAGNNSPRPKPPTASRVKRSGRPARFHSTVSRPSASADSLRSIGCACRNALPLTAGCSSAALALR